MSKSIYTPRLRLDPISLSHLEGFHEIWSIPEATKWSSRGVLKTIDQAEAWLSGLLPENRPGAENFAIFLRDSDPTTTSTTSTNVPTTNPTPTPPSKRVLGIVGVHRVEPIPELGYILHPSVWGRGYATEAVGAFVQHFWEKFPDSDVIEAKVDQEHPVSIRVLVKCGFEKGDVLVGGAESPWLEPKVRNLVVLRLRRGSVI